MGLSMARYKGGSSSIYKTILTTLICGSMNASAFSQSAPLSWSAFDACFKRVEFLDSLVMDYTLDFTDSNQMVKPKKSIPISLREKMLPDSLSEFSIPIWRFSRLGFNYYFVINQYDVWREGCLIIYDEANEHISSILQVHLSEPGDGMQYYLKSVLLENEEGFLLVSRIHINSTRTSRFGHFFISERIQRTKNYIWKEKLKSFEIDAISEKKSSYKFKTY